MSNKTNNNSSDLDAAYARYIEHCDKVEATKEWLLSRGTCLGIGTHTQPQEWCPSGYDADDVQPSHFLQVRIPPAITDLVESFKNANKEKVTQLICQDIFNKGLMHYALSEEAAEEAVEFLQFIHSRANK